MPHGLAPHRSWAPGPCTRTSALRLGAEDCTPQINTSEIIVDFQWHFPAEVHLPVVVSKGSSLVQWIVTRISWHADPDARRSEDGARPEVAA